MEFYHGSYFISVHALHNLFPGREHELADSCRVCRRRARDALPVRLESGGVGDGAEVRLQGTDRRIAGEVRWIASEAAFTPFYALTQQDATRLAYLAEIDLTEASGLPVGVPVEVRFPGLGASDPAP